MDWINIFKPLPTFLWPALLINLSNIKINFWNAKNQTRGCWVGSLNATSVLGSPPPPLQFQSKCFDVRNKQRRETKKFQFQEASLQRPTKGSFHQLTNFMDHLKCPFFGWDILKMPKLVEKEQLRKRKQIRERKKAKKMKNQNLEKRWVLGMWPKKFGDFKWGFISFKVAELILDLACCVFFGKKKVSTG